jgi:hypothetical protein
MKTTALAEAMICIFSVVFEALPAQSQRRINSILTAALSAKVISDADAVRVIESLVEHRSASSSADQILPRNRLCH